MELDIKQFETGLDAIRTEVLKKIQESKDEWKAHTDKLKTEGAEWTECKTQFERAMKRFDAMEAEWSRTGPPVTQQEKSLGDLLIENENIQELAKRIRGTGWTRGLAASMPLKGMGQFSDFLGLKTVITSTAVGSSTPGILTPQRLPGIVKPGVRRLRVRDLLNRISVTSNAVEWVKENVFTNAASPTAETISKPESALTFTIDSIPIRTIAHVIPASNQILDDFPQLGGYVNVRLLEGLKDVEDYEIVGGDGTGQHLSGLTVEATAYDTARNVAADTRIDKLNHAISQIEDVLQVADGIILNPRDWRAIQLIKEEPGGANTGAYLLGGPQGVASPVLWGLPVATTTAVPVGQFFVGSFDRYVVVLDRMEARVDISTEDGDNFRRNMVTIRAEERVALAVTRADAIVFGSF